MSIESATLVIPTASTVLNAAGAPLLPRRSAPYYPFYGYYLMTNLDSLNVVWVSSRGAGAVVAEADEAHLIRVGETFSLAYEPGSSVRAIAVGGACKLLVEGVESL